MKENVASDCLAMDFLSQYDLFYLHQLWIRVCGRKWEFWLDGEVRYSMKRTLHTFKTKILGKKLLNKY